ncbi:uncharacterized protein L969DRAFT_62163 [Mixia osmundae IAM 14324]|uniref:Nuclear condensin complex subunit 3 C-terminal domain-containing protein n=1 Tax=Mixia osmundae (strain CBS 9802 / IAM 14324 / JCM 22182 / KY 12970) TaxID=764103 RepID=G7E0T2_MIXOS|nr:uncharacterized protein L969DRAFT_62163 [Mixia osmundae IAM 14324]KEI39472.1 hypothetical protein L969DRAFT_62163 [Mixia osmundae IAM 14324]GAA96442.1 hypothetical protein E5Q_03109 [Mixia osmundae IAM 14324]
MGRQKAAAAQTELLSSQTQVTDGLSALPTIFDQVQQSVVNHRKNLILLHGLFLRCSSYTESDAHTKRPNEQEMIHLTGERLFLVAMRDIVSRLLPVGKGRAVGPGQKHVERVLRFIAGFLALATLREQDSKPQEDEDEDQDGPASRLVNGLVKYLLRGFEAKNKTVRWRSVQIVALVLRALPDLDENLFKTLRESFLIRARDKEANVRTQAAIGLGKLRSLDDDEPAPVESTRAYDAKRSKAKSRPAMSASSSASSIAQPDTPTQVLLSLMQFDPSAEVRRAALLAMEEPDDRSLPVILDRVRDIDPTNRRLLFQTTLAIPTVPQPASGNPLDSAQLTSPIEQDAPSPVKAAGPATPAVQRSLGLWDQMTRAQRTAVLKSGLNDREGAVKRSAIRLVGHWAGSSVESLLAMLGRLEVAKETKVCEGALLAAFEAHPEILESMTFGEDHWSALTPEKALLIRVTLEHCHSKKDEAKLESLLPVATALSFRIDSLFKAMLELIAHLQNLDEDALAEQKKLAHRGLRAQFIMSQLLAIALFEDYADEIGRRKMFTLLRDLVSHPMLPTDLIPVCLDVLSKLSSSERDFMQVIVEIVQELRDTDKEQTNEETDSGSDNDSMASLTEEELAKMAKGRQAPAVPTQTGQFDENPALILRCLEIIRGLLERVMGTMRDNPILEGLAQELVAPAVRSKQAPIRAQGLITLGLCSLLDLTMAQRAFGTLAGQARRSEGDLQVRLYQVIFDILMLHGLDFMASRDDENRPNFESEQVVDFLVEALNQPLATQAAAAIGISKLMLAGHVTDSKVLQDLVLIYFAPETADNQELRQCLAYFFPVYCYSSSHNQRAMQEIFVSTLDILTATFEEIGPEEDMVAPLQIGLHLLEWTNPERLIESASNAREPEVQIDIALELLKEVLQDPGKERRKLLCQLVSKIVIVPEVSAISLQSLQLLLTAIDQHRPLTDTVSRNSLVRIHTAAAKRRQDIGEDAVAGDAVRLTELQTFVAGVTASAEDQEADEPTRKKARPKAHTLVATGSSSSSSDDEVSQSASLDAPDPAATPSRRSVRATPRKIKRIIEDSESESEQDSVQADEY